MSTSTATDEIGIILQGIGGWELGGNGLGSCPVESFGFDGIKSAYTIG